MLSVVLVPLLLILVPRAVVLAGENELLVRALKQPEQDKLGTPLSQAISSRNWGACMACALQQTVCEHNVDRPVCRLRLECDLRRASAGHATEIYGL